MLYRYTAAVPATYYYYCYYTHCVRGAVQRAVWVIIITRVSVLHFGGAATPAENDTLSGHRGRRAGSLGIRQSATACVIAFTWPIN
jgi:hypothetical protein